MGKPKPMERCCNGCDAPPHAPSLVLCKACFDKLSAKFEGLKILLSMKEPESNGR